MTLKTSLSHIFLFILINSTPVFAQENGNSYEIRTIFGAHGLKDQGHLFQDKIYGADLIFDRTLVNDPSDWIRHSNAKSFGFAFVYRNFTNLRGYQDTITNGLGSSFGVVARLKFQMLDLKRVKLNFIPALGISYLNNRYFSNPQNRFISTHLNKTILGEVEAEIPLSKQLSLLSGGSYLHISNAGIVIPNGGLNVGTVYIGLKYTEKTKEKPNEDSKIFKPLQRNSFELMGGAWLQRSF